MVFHEILRLFFKLSTFLWEAEQAFCANILAYFQQNLFDDTLFLSADSHSSALLVRPSKEEEEEGRRRKEGGLFSNSLDNMEDLKVWGC